MKLTKVLSELDDWEWAMISVRNTGCGVEISVCNDHRQKRTVTLSYEQLSGESDIASLIIGDVLRKFRDIRRQKHAV